MQFFITAYDGTDKDALDRRMRVRPQHLENIKKMNVISAGGITKDNKPIGSFLIMEFENKDKLQEYLDNEPYVIHNVWQSIKVETCNTVIVKNEIQE